MVCAIATDVRTCHLVTCSYICSYLHSIYSVPIVRVAVQRPDMGPEKEGKREGGKEGKRERGKEQSNAGDEPGTTMAVAWHGMAWHGHKHSRRTQSHNHIITQSLNHSISQSLARQAN